MKLLIILYLIFLALLLLTTNTNMRKIKSFFIKNVPFIKKVKNRK